MHLARDVHASGSLALATTQSVFDLGAINFPYIGLMSGDYAQTFIPKSEVLFSLSAGTIVVAGAGEDQQVRVTCNLPRGWAYVFLEATLRITNADVADWDDCASSEMKDNDSGTVNFITHMTMCTGAGIAHASTTQPIKTYHVMNPINKVFLCNGAGDGRLRFVLHNLVIDGAAGTCDAYARFLRFELNQAHHYAVNTPVSVRG